MIFFWVPYMLVTLIILPFNPPVGLTMLGIAAIALFIKYPEALQALVLWIIGMSIPAGLLWALMSGAISTSMPMALTAIGLISFCAACTYYYRTQTDDAHITTGHKQMMYEFEDRTEEEEPEEEEEVEEGDQSSKDMNQKSQERI